MKYQKLQNTIRQGLGGKRSKKKASTYLGNGVGEKLVV